MLALRRWLNAGRAGCVPHRACEAELKVSSNASQVFDQITGPQLLFLQRRDLELLHVREINLPFQAMDLAVQRTVTTLEILQAHLLHSQCSSGSWVLSSSLLDAEEEPLRTTMKLRLSLGASTSDFGNFALSSPAQRDLGLKHSRTFRRAGERKVRAAPAGRSQSV
jgi:hypothetical protein